MRTVILAGGGSRRMGQDKAMLPYGGTTLLQYMIDKYAVLGDVAVSVNAPGKYAFTGAAELPDQFPDQGPLNGLVTGFGDGTASELFLTAVDLPCGEPALVRRLALLRGDADACILRRGRKGIEPLFAVYGRRCGAAALACLSAGKRSVFDLLERLQVRYVAPEEVADFDLERLLTNVNTPEDYSRLGGSIIR